MPRIDDKILLRRYHEEGDLAAREKLIEQYMSLVRSLARRYSYRGEQLEDLVQIGAIGLIKAIDRFDIDRGVELTTYATPNIIGEIKRHFRDKGWSVRVPRGLQELNVQLSKLVEQLTVQLGRSPTIAELAKGAGVEEEEVLEALDREDPRRDRRRGGERAESRSGLTQPIDEAAFVRAQYETEDNLRARKSAYVNAEGDDPREFAFEAVAEADPRRVLEVGGGEGELAGRIRDELGVEVTAVDQSERMVEIQRSKGI